MGKRYEARRDGIGYGVWDHGTGAWKVYPQSGPGRNHSWACAEARMWNRQDAADPVREAQDSAHRAGSPGESARRFIVEYEDRQEVGQADTKRLKSVLDDATLYWGDNGACFCGNHAGMTAKATGYDLDGTKCQKIGPNEAAGFRAVVGRVPACETCAAKARKETA